MTGGIIGGENQQLAEQQTFLVKKCEGPLPYLPLTKVINE